LQGSIATQVVLWDLLRQPHCKFSESEDDRILKIGQFLQSYRGNKNNFLTQK